VKKGGGRKEGISVFSVRISGGEKFLQKRVARKKKLLLHLRVERKGRPPA